LKYTRGNTCKKIAQTLRDDASVFRGDKNLCNLVERREAHGVLRDGNEAIGHENLKYLAKAALMFNTTEKLAAEMNENLRHLVGKETC